MKFTPVVIFLSLLFNAHAQSPISLTSAVMPGVGFSETYAVDTPLTSVAYGNAGANQVYNFSALANTHSLTLTYVANPSPATFTTGNQALSSNGSYVVLDSTTTKYQAVGLQGTAYGLSVKTKLSPAEDLYHFPEQYQSTFASNWGFYQGFTGDEVGQSSVDSVREIYTDKFSSVVDGWGKVITPMGSYRALRIKRIDTTVTTVEAYYFFSWHNENVNGQPVKNITTEYSYVAKETKGAVVSFSYDSAGNMKAAQYSLIPPAAPIAGFSYTTGSAGLAMFTDTSEGFPTRYHWDFGDGDTSNTANPTHTYAANGTYNVCETVYNASGSNTICHSVQITNIVTHSRPVANNDSATVHQPNGDTLVVTANDHSPSNDAFCITAIYGGQYFTVLGCNDVVFNPNANFTGYDSCHYIICNTNQPTLCDTAVVVIDVIASAVHLAPVAVNDTAIDIENQTDVINVTGNDHSPSGDAFCVTHVYGSTYFTVNGCNNLTFTPAANFTGNDTVYYIECNTGQPTLCDTARVIVEVLAPHTAPVAVNDVDTVLQPAANIFNVTANDYSPTSDSFCITSIYGGTGFNVLNCNELTFNPDSTFTGNDTVWYVICNTGQPTLCDTASVVIVVVQNLALLPVADFSILDNSCEILTVQSNSLNTDSLFWHFHSNQDQPTDTIVYSLTQAQYGLFGNNFVTIDFCLSVFNRFGSNIKCDTVENFCQGITEVQLSGINIYPNPASSQLTIDMRNNTSAITRNYTAIEIYNAVGQKVKSISKGSNSDMMNISVADLAAGIYLAAIVDGNGVHNTLGKFTVMQ